MRRNYHKLNLYVKLFNTFVLVRIRTGLKNRIHALVDKRGIFHSFSDLFGKKGREFLSGLKLREPYQRELGGYLQVIEHIDKLEGQVARQIKISLKKDSRADRLMTVPGIGELTAHLILAEIGEIHRFTSSKKLCSYGCLVSSTSQSAHHTYHGPVGRHGNLYLKWAMVEAAQKATHKDPALAAFYTKMTYRRGKAKARVALAAKLLTAVYYVLKRDEDYKINSLTKIHLGKPVFFPGHQKTIATAIR